MKKIISFVIAAVMILSLLPATVSASPSGVCLVVKRQLPYLYFNAPVAATDTKLTFELAMEDDGGENPPLVNLNSNVFFNPEGVTAGGRDADYNWGEIVGTRFHLVEVYYHGGTISVTVDGNLLIDNGNGSCLNGGFYFIGGQGTNYIDNLKMESGGHEIATLDFDNEGVYMQYKNADSSATRGNVPQGSYLVYEPIVVPDDVEYIFNSMNAAGKLSVESGETIIAGDVNNDGILTSRDSRALKAFMVGTGTLENEAAADINSDGFISSRDSLALKRTLTGLAEIIEIPSGASGSAEFAVQQQSALLSAGDTVAQGIDATLTLDTPIDPDVYKYAVVTYMTPNKSDDKNSAAAVQSAFGAYGNLTEFNLNTNGKFHSEIIDLSAISTWNGDQVTYRYFVAANAGDRIYVDSIIFSASLSKANAAKSAREAAKAAIKIVDAEPTQPTEGAIGSLVGSDYVIRFDTAAKISAKVSNGNNARASFNDSALVCTATGSADPGVYLDLTDEAISANDYKYITYTYKVPTDNHTCKDLVLYYVVGDIERPTGGFETDPRAQAKTGKYGTIVIDLTQKSNWSGRIKGIRIDFFTDCQSGDKAYVDSIIFSRTQSDAVKAGNTRVKERNGGGSASSVADIFNEYYAYYQYNDSREYITGEPALYFQWNPNKDTFTAKSLGDRFARAISEATGFEFTCEVYCKFADLYNKWGTNESANVYYTLTCEGESYCVYLPTYIIPTGGYSDPLDGRAGDDVGIPNYNTNTWYENGLGGTDSSYFCTGSGLSIHSSHENRLVETPYGNFAVIPTWEDSNRWSQMGAARATVYRIYDNGSSKSLWDFEFKYHTSKPNIYYADDGLVYVICADDCGDSVSVYVAYFNPANPDGNGNYSVTSSRSNRSYNGGGAPGGYGYIQPMLDTDLGKFVIMACGGSSGDGYFGWVFYNYRSHMWENAACTTALSGTYRHCYLYGFCDGNRGMYVVGGRDVLLTTLGIRQYTAGADYAWDEINMFYFPDIYSTNYQMYCCVEADYTQMGRTLFPVIGNNRRGDAYMTSDGYMHVLTTKEMHGYQHHDVKSRELWHTVYDLNGARPQMIYNKPITFINDGNNYSCRMTEAEDGELYIIAVPVDTPVSARAEIWRQNDANAFTFRLAGVTHFSTGGEVESSVILSNRRNSVFHDNTVSCIYPNKGESYRFFTVTID